MKNSIVNPFCKLQSWNIIFNYNDFWIQISNIQHWIKLKLIWSPKKTSGRKICCLIPNSIFLGCMRLYKGIYKECVQNLSSKTYHRVFLFSFLFIEVQVTESKEVSFNYILFIVLLQLSQFFPHCLPPPNNPHPHRQSPHHRPCPGVLHTCSLATLLSMLYFTFSWLFCNYQFVFLGHFTFFAHFPKVSSHLATIKTFPVSMILFLFCLFISCFRFISW